MSSEGIVNSKRNRYLAKVSLSLSLLTDLTDEEKREIEKCCKIKPPYEDGSSRGFCDKSLEYPEWVYPRFNEESEYNLGRLNRSINEEILSLGKKKVITAEECLQHILGNFCIRSPNGSWAISDDVIVNQECTHIDAKR